MIIDRYIFDVIDSNMYVIIDRDNAIIIDPHEDAELKKRLVKNNIKKIAIFFTHEHIDHISGANYYLDFDTCIYCSEECKDMVENHLRELKMQFASVFVGASGRKKEKLTALLKRISSIRADAVLCDRATYTIGTHNLYIRTIKGHSKGSVFIVMDNKAVFTGDSLLTDRPVVTDLPGGSRKDYYEITYPIIGELDKTLTVYPGHGDAMLLEKWRSSYAFI